ncbi:MAG: hypothetical protein NWR72_16635 [Bacteroidia bacterium]|nr:hypothetical protein [Bacteroidia bacterium]
MLVSTPSAWAQSTTAREAKILMRDGTEYKGDILQQIPDSIVTIEMVGGSILVLAQRDIAEIVPVPHRYRSIKYYTNRNRKLVQVKTHGFVNQVSAEFYPRESQWGGTALGAGLHYSLNYRFSYLLGVGAGVGIEGYDGGAAMPIFANITGDLTPGRVTPTYFGKVGYAAGVASGWRNVNFQGGLMTEAGIGIKYRTRSNIEWVIGLGYRRQPVTEFPDPRWFGQDLPLSIRTIHQGIAWHYSMLF